ncbi:chromosome condensation protein CrcB [Blastococcus sp. CCUG 61487]|nr:chromosome condensation protein CrcB [Blastococcus sp. CCUG 61487]
MAYVAAALGGGLGALARWGVAAWLPWEPAGWPWATLLVNLSGCLLLGLLLALVFARSADGSWLRPFLGTGVLGGYTTYSAFAVEVVQLAEAGSWATAAGYLAASVLGGIVAAGTGLAAGRAIARPRPDRDDMLDAEESIA